MKQPTTPPLRLANRPRPSTGPLAAIQYGNVWGKPRSSTNLSPRVQIPEYGWYLWC